MGQIEPWQVLAIAGVLLAIAEIFTPTFVSLPAGLAFLATALVALVVEDKLTLSFILALNLAIVYGVFLRLVWPRLSKNAPKTAAEAMSGKVVVVSEAIDPQTGAGYVKLYGDTWQAIATESYAVGTRVVITATEGNKVVVGSIDPSEDG